MSGAFLLMCKRSGEAPAAQSRKQMLCFAQKDVWSTGENPQGLEGYGSVCIVHAVALRSSMALKIRPAILNKQKAMNGLYDA
jgi:hypothetical protein